MKKIIFTIISVILSLTICGCGVTTLDIDITSSLENSNYIESDDSTEAVLMNGYKNNLDGDYWYFTKTYPCDNCKIMKYNIKTNELAPACADPLCDHSKDTCPLGNTMSIAFVKNGTIYFTSHDMESDTMSFNSYDTKTMDLKTFKTYGKYEYNYFIFYEYNGYFYYVCKHLRSGGDADDKFDYLPAICRLNEKTLTEEVYQELESDKVKMMFIDDIGRIYLQDIEKKYIFYYDINNEKYVNLTEPGSATSGGFYSDGNLYFSDSKNVYYGDDNDKNCFKGSIKCVNVATGEQKIIAENVYNFFLVTKKYVYYIPYSPRVFGDGTYINNNDKEVRVWSYSNGEIWRYDINFGNSECVFKNEDCEIGFTDLVQGNYYYAYCTRFVKNKKYIGNNYRINLTTGEMEVYRDYENVKVYN